MPLSEKQLIANRANAQKSTGPRTPAGKRQSSRNATRHGLLARALLIDGESPEAFNELLASLQKEFEPNTPTEYTLVDNLAAAQWRRLRLWTMESSGISHDMRRRQNAGETTGQTAGQSEDSPTRAMIAMRSSGDRTSPLEIVRRYETALDRQHHRALRALMQMKEEKNARTKATQILHENKEPAA